MSADAGRVEALYVWVQLDGEPVIAGRFERRGRVGVFYYANSYVRRPAAFAIDPINLPLLPEREFLTQANGGVWGVLLDAGPDSWGQRLLAQLSPSRPRDPLEFLLAGNGEGVGCLLFSLSQARVKRPELRGPSVDLGVLEQAATDLLARDAPLPPELQEALLAGGSLGGARPKAAVLRDGQPWIAKFSRDTDLYNEVRAEYATLSLAKAAGIEVAEHRLLTTPDGRDVLLVKRFDVAATGGKLPYISGHALLNLHRFQENNPAHGYPGLAALLRRFAAQPRAAVRELFRRMAFRALIGDTDDHGRNLGFLRVGGAWRHAPLFDALPHINVIGLQAMPVGREGRRASVANLLSMSEHFALSRDAARALLTQLQGQLAGWEEHFRTAGLSARDVALLRPCFAGLKAAVPAS